MPDPYVLTFDRQQLLPLRPGMPARPGYGPPVVGDFEILPIAAVSANTEDIPHVAANVLDESTSTRWSGEGWGAALTIDLGETQTVGAVEIAFWQGDNRRAFFDIHRPISPTEWAPHFVGGVSSGATNDFQTFHIENLDTRFLRILGRGNQNTMWNSLTMLRVRSQTDTNPAGMAPILLSFDATPGDGAISLNWLVSSQTGGELERSLTGAGSWGQLTPLSFQHGPNMSFLDDTALLETDYWYRVNVTNSVGGASAQVGPVQVTAPAPPPDPDPPPSDVTHGFYLQESMTGLAGAGVSTSQLTSSSMSATSSHGQVIEFLNIQRSPGTSQPVLRVQHNNVHIRYCRVGHPGGANGIEIVNGVTGTIIEYCSFDGMFPNYNGNFGSIGILARHHNNTSITRCHFIGNRDMTHVYNGDNFLFAENFQAELAYNSGQSSGFHCDGGLMVRGSSNIVSEKNQFRSYIAGSGSAVYADQSVVHEYDMRDNHIRSQLNSSGQPRGYGCYGGNTGHQYNSENTGVRINGNWFTPPWQFSGTLGRGTNAAVNVNKPGHTFNNNFMLQLVGGQWQPESSPLPPQSWV